VFNVGAAAVKALNGRYAVDLRSNLDNHHPHAQTATTRKGNN